MSSETSDRRGRVLGIGGIFFKSRDKQTLENWYRDHLGIGSSPEQGAHLRWRSHEDPAQEHLTVWSVFPDDTNYFDPGQQAFMINYIVDDLDALLTKLQADGVKIDPKREDYDYGRFAWIFDADGNKIELWQPR
jgi:catechol 2,3-dioxygenase-like lactoylglutathione lyase family enzyme